MINNTNIHKHSEFFCTKANVVLPNEVVKSCYCRDCENLITRKKLLFRTLGFDDVK